MNSNSGKIRLKLIHWSQSASKVSKDYSKSQNSWIILDKQNQFHNQQQI